MTDERRDTPEFKAYLRARDAVMRMKGAGGTHPFADPSPYWAEELANIDYLIDASPLIIRKLRQHAFHITGVRPYDYRDKGDGRRDTFERRLQALRAIGGAAPLVPESPALGGFGFALEPGLFNVDTLKYYEVLVGMERGGVLAAMRAIDKPVVCEIGAGWGGFAFQFKTAFPRATYVIVDLPELFLFSATYLGAVFAEARLHFVESPATANREEWGAYDFVFVPNTLSHVVAAHHLDLTINMVSFQEMTDRQVRGYADMAADAGCPLLYSLNRESSPYNTELVSVSEALADRFQLTEVPVLESDYTAAMRKPPKPGRIAERSPLRTRHLVGRREAIGPRRPGSARRAATEGPPVVLGMTLHNNARHLRQAMDSLLAQTFDAFHLVLLDDASTDGTEVIAREYEARDPRVTYHRHPHRRAMIATWRAVVDLAEQAFPNAPYFAWVSDHDRWHPRWLECLVWELDNDPETVLAYPITRRMTSEGEELDKGPRLFDTAGRTDLASRWRHFCREGVGAGDMVYGLIRMQALRQAGTFRTVLRPDRLLMAELTLRGRIRQVPEVLWYRRQSAGTSVQRQRHSLVVAGEEPRGFGFPPWWQHSLVLWREYAAAVPPPLALSRAQWRRMLLQYQLTYGWRHFRKSETAHGINTVINRVVLARKLVKHHFHHGVYNTLMALRAARGRARRMGRRAVYEVLMFTHRIGLRGRGETPLR